MHALKLIGISRRKVQKDVYKIDFSHKFYYDWRRHMIGTSVGQHQKNTATCCCWLANHMNMCNWFSLVQNAVYCMCNLLTKTSRLLHHFNNSSCLKCAVIASHDVFLCSWQDLCQFHHHPFTSRLLLLLDIMTSTFGTCCLWVQLLSKSRS